MPLNKFDGILVGGESNFFPCGILDFKIYAFFSRTRSHHFKSSTWLNLFERFPIEGECCLANHLHLIACFVC